MHVLILRNFEKENEMDVSKDNARKHSLIDHYFQIFSQFIGRSSCLFVCLIDFCMIGNLFSKIEWEEEQIIYLIFTLSIYYTVILDCHFTIPMPLSPLAIIHSVSWTFFTLFKFYKIIRNTISRLPRSII